jgi:hypothetical protein
MRVETRRNTLMLTDTYPAANLGQEHYMREGVFQVEKARIRLAYSLLSSRRAGRL